MNVLNRMPSIGQFRNVIKNIQYQARYIGMDENDEPIYDNTVKLPVITMNGTVKVHGTYAGVSFHKDTVYAQSKKNIITPEKDNAGFAFFVKSKHEFFMSLKNMIKEKYCINFNDNIVTIMGEYAGKGIQSKVAVSELSKRLFVFGIKVKPLNEDIPSYWIDHDIFDHEYINQNAVYNINQFGTFSIDVDFENPSLSQNKIIEMTMDVEKECPVGKFFDVVGYGEGIVFTFDFKGNRYAFKSKGSKHAGKSKVKKLKKVDDAKLQKINDVVDKVVTQWRLEQMYTEVFDTINGGTGDVRKTGDFLRAVHQDIIKEESDTIADAGLIPKDVNGKVSKVARIWFMEKLDAEAGLI